MKLLCVITALAFLLAASASAETFDRTRSCSGRSPGVCLTFDSTDGTADSAIFRLRDGLTYYMYFDPDTAVSSVPVDGAQIFLRFSTSCATASDNTSTRVLVNQDGVGGQDDVAIDGTNTTDAQRRYIWNLKPGCYFIERAVAAAAGDAVQVSFESQ